MLFISISPKCSTWITIPWTALIYVSLPHPKLNLTSFCSDSLIERQLKMDLQGSGVFLCVYLCIVVIFTSLFKSYCTGKGFVFREMCPCRASIRAQKGCLWNPSYHSPLCFQHVEGCVWHKHLGFYWLLLQQNITDTKLVSFSDIQNKICLVSH